MIKERTNPDTSIAAASSDNVLVSKRSLRPRLNMSQISGIIGVLVIGGLIFMAVFAAQLSPYDPSERVGKPFEPPSDAHRLGTNDIGQDLLSELIYGSRVSLTVGIVAALVAIFIGTTVGLLAGFYPGMVGNVLMRIVDIILVLPFLPLLIMLAAFLGQSLFNTVVIIGFLIWAGTARIIRAQALTISQHDYVLCARTIGAGDLHIIIRHILPLVLLLAVGQFVMATSGAILLEAALSFLGLGDATQKSWGAMLYWAQARGVFLTPAWKWWVLPAGLMISLAALGFALIGFSLEQRIDPRLRGGRR